MITHSEFLLRAELSATTLETWIAEGWIRPDPTLDEAALARTALIRELTERLGVNTEGVDVALTLLDQIHGLRRALRQMEAALEGLPPQLRQATLEALRQVR
jgi:chaperone modulatory protein CbpM